MNAPCRHLLQQLDKGRLRCLQCGDDVTDGDPIVPVAGQLGNIRDDPLLDYLAAGGVVPRAPR